MPDTDTRKIAEAVNGFGQLTMAEVNGLEYNVLSWRNDSVTAHKVNVRDLTCTCKDEEYNREDPEVCAHLAYAIYKAPETPDLDEIAFWSLVNHHDRILAQTTETETDGHSEQSEATGATQEQVEESIQEAEADLDRVETARDWLETGFAQPEHVEIYATTHNGVNGAALEPDNQAMTDGVYESFKAVVNAVDGSTVHVGFGDDACNTCGQQDGEFWYHIPDSVLEGWA